MCYEITVATAYEKPIVLYCFLGFYYGVGDVFESTETQDKMKLDLNNIEEQDFLSYVLNSNLVCEAGERYLYNNAETFLLSVVFQELTNQNLGSFLLNNVVASKINDKWNTKT